MVNYKKINEIAQEKNYSTLIIGGGKRTHDDPPLAHLQTYRQILLFSEDKHKTVQDLYLNDDQVDALICGVAAFVGRKGIRKVAVLPSTFCNYLSIHSDANPIRSLAIYKSNFDILLAPIASGGHWYLAAFYMDTKIVVVYDSLHWPVPSIFTRVKKCIESVLRIQFTLKNRNYTVTKQQNGYDCGVNCFRNAEEICFHGKCNLFNPYYPEAERARAREILRRLKNKEITDEWVPHVATPTHYTNLNKPTVEPGKEKEKQAKSSDDDSDIEILEEDQTLKDNVSTTDKKADDAKHDETNICDESIGCLNDPIEKMGIDDSIEIQEEIFVAINGNNVVLKKNIKKEKMDDDEFVESKKGIKRALQEDKNDQEIKKIKTDDKADDAMEVDETLMTTEEETQAQKDKNESFEEFCRRKRISKKAPKSKNAYQKSISTADQILKENNRKKEYMQNKRGSISIEQKNESNKISQIAKEVNFQVTLCQSTVINVVGSTDIETSSPYLKIDLDEVSKYDDVLVEIKNAFVRSLPASVNTNSSTSINICSITDGLQYVQLRLPACFTSDLKKGDPVSVKGRLNSTASPIYITVEDSINFSKKDGESLPIIQVLQSNKAAKRKSHGSLDGSSEAKVKKLGDG
uniref:Ubiquitin-like protease family profile domain-containing protein n=1 Tax=Panagrolaimus davidi TaxID=227884 RepID=A0A914RCG0_9BILA